MAASEEKLRAAFAVFDTNGDGTISKDELAAILTREGGGQPLSPEEVEQVFAKMDLDMDGSIAMSEFAQAWSSDGGLLGAAADADGHGLVPHMSKAEVREVFGLIDGNGCGLVGRYELKRALKQHARVRELLGLPEMIKRGDGSQARFDAIFSHMDADASGKFCLKDFLKVLALPPLTKEEVTEVFGLIDGNGCGLVGRFEIRKALQNNEKVRLLFGLPAGAPTPCAAPTPTRPTSTTPSGRASYPSR